MKKSWLTTGLALTLAFTLTACGGSGGQTTTPADDTAPTQSAPAANESKPAENISGAGTTWLPVKQIVYRRVESGDKVETFYLYDYDEDGRLSAATHGFVGYDITELEKTYEYTVDEQANTVTVQQKKADGTAENYCQIYSYNDAGALVNYCSKSTVEDLVYYDYSLTYNADGTLSGIHSNKEDSKEEAEPTYDESGNLVQMTWAYNYSVFTYNENNQVDSVKYYSYKDRTNTWERDECWVAYEYAELPVTQSALSLKPELLDRLLMRLN